MDHGTKDLEINMNATLGAKETVSKKRKIDLGTWNMFAFTYNNDIDSYNFFYNGKFVAKNIILDSKYFLSDPFFKLFIGNL